VLQCVAVCCSVLPCVVVCCRVLQCVAVCCCATFWRNTDAYVWRRQSFIRVTRLIHVCGMTYPCVVECVAVCWSVLQCVAVCCSVLQCVAVCCSVLQCVAWHIHVSVTRVPQRCGADSMKIRWALCEACSFVCACVCVCLFDFSTDTRVPRAQGFLKSEHKNTHPRSRIVLTRRVPVCGNKYDGLFLTSVLMCVCVCAMMRSCVWRPAFMYVSWLYVCHTMLLCRFQKCKMNSGTRLFFTSLFQHM